MFQNMSHLRVITPYYESCFDFTCGIHWDLIITRGKVEGGEPMVTA